MGFYYWLRVISSFPYNTSNYSLKDFDKVEKSYVFDFYFDIRNSLVFVDLRVRCIIEITFLLIMKYNFSEYGSVF